MSESNPEAGERRPILITPVAAAQEVVGLRRALEHGGWQVIVAPDVASYAASVHACIVIISQESSAHPEVNAAINAHFPILIPILTAPMPLPFAQWSAAPILVSATDTMQQAAGAEVLRTLGKLDLSAAQFQSAPLASRRDLLAIPTLATPYFPRTGAAAPQPPMGFPGTANERRQIYDPPNSYSVKIVQRTDARFWVRTLVICAVVASLGLCGLFALSHNIVGPSVSGQWTMDFEGDSSAQLTLSQNFGSLNGTLKAQDQYLPMTLTGNVSGTSVTFNGTLTPAAGGDVVDTVTFTGTISSDGSQMSGTDHIVLTSASTGSQGESFYSSWTAVRATSGSSSS